MTPWTADGGAGARSILAVRDPDPLRDQAALSWLDEVIAGH
jgi:hypothetical protein